MEKSLKTKNFYLKYLQTLNEIHKKGEDFTEELLLQFINDRKLIDHIFFFQKLFTGGILVPLEIIAAEDKIFAKVLFKAKHTGSLEGIPSTNKEISIPFALGYTIKNDKIIDFWAIASETQFIEQLGLTTEQVEVPIPV